MGWTRLDLDPDARESTLQQLLDRWRDRRYFCLAGTPLWLAVLKPPRGGNQRPWHDARGYRWQADAELNGPDSRWIVELKHAAKWEPQALAEVLHHAQALEEQLGTRVEPAIISSYNCWLRMAVWYLRKREVVVHYCEGYVLCDRRRTPQIIWFDDPFAKYRPIDTAPKVLPKRLRIFKWSVSENGKVWRVVRERQTTKSGSPFIEGKIAQLAEVTDGRYVLWLGDGAADQSTRSDAKDLLDRYFVSDAGSDARQDIDITQTIDGWLGD